MNTFSGEHGAGMLHGILLSALVGVVAGIWALLRRRQELGRVARRESFMWDEFEAYARLDTTLAADGDTRPLARRVCKLVLEKSRFNRVAMLVRDAEGKLFVSGSVGMDDVTVRSLQDWGVEVVRQERGLGADGPAKAPARDRIGPGSFSMVLAPPEIVDGIGIGSNFEREQRTVVVSLLRSATGTVLGALVVGLEHREKRTVAMAPLESLAVKLARTLENASLSERLLRSEKLAGLGQLAGGVAHELNNPLTSVLGFAELIAETASEPRVREDADTIIREALRMKETVESLLNFWRPVTLLDEPVDFAVLLAELAKGCEEKLRERGVRLLVESGEGIPLIRGNRDRLRQVLEHLLNNAAQAIAAGKEKRKTGEGPREGTRAMRGTQLPRGVDDGDMTPTIRVTVSHEGQTMHLIVSDTGPGFIDPAKAFDPFYTTRQPGEGAGLGLSLCYGIVREHSGEISAFNLHPHGAAVVMELPVRDAVTSEVEEIKVSDSQAK